MVLCLAWLSFVGWRAARDTNWNRHKPVWWLVGEAGGRNVVARDAAFDELVGRMMTGKLSPEREAALLDAALDVQADRSRPWTFAVSNVIFWAHDAGKLPDDKWRRYGRQVAPVELVARGTVPRGDPPAFALVVPSPRLYAGQVFTLQCKVLEARLGGLSGTGQTVEGDARSVAYHLRTGATAETAAFLLRLPADAHASLPDGRYTLSVSMRFTLEEHASGGPMGPHLLRVDETRDLSCPVTVVPADAVTVTLDPDPSLRPAVEESVTARFTQANAHGYCEVLVEAHRPPIDLAYTVVARHGAREWRVGAARFKAGESGRSTGILNLLTGLPEFAPTPQGGQWESARFDLILRPSVEQAVRTLDITRIWAGEIVFKDVMLNRGPNTYRPAAPGDVATTEPPASLLAP
jgi:hypothetical protein